MKLERWYTVFGQLHINVEKIGNFGNLDTLLKIIWSYANGQACSATISIDMSKHYALKVGNMMETLSKDISPRMICRTMELTPEEYQILFIDLIRASKAIYSKMNVKEICEINLNPERRLTDVEMETFRISYRCPICKHETIETLNSECDGANEIVYYGCSNCKVDFSIWKEPASGMLLGGK